MSDLDDLFAKLPNDLPPDTKLGDIPEAREYLQDQAQQLARQVAQKGARSFMTAVTEHVNGHGQRGRVAPPLPEHTFKDSGITIHIRKVGPTTQQRLAQQIRQEQPAPPIPIVETEAGPEPNPADPQYIAAVEAWEQQINLELSNRLMLIAALEAEVEIDDPARREIARKQRSLEIGGVPWTPDPRMTPEEDERVFYVLHVAAASPEDLGEFGQAVLRRSVPTEEAVQAQIATFPRDLPE